MKNEMPDEIWVKGNDSYSINCGFLADKDRDRFVEPNTAVKYVRADIAPSGEEVREAVAECTRLLDQNNIVALMVATEHLRVLVKAAQSKKSDCQYQCEQDEGEYEKRCVELIEENKKLKELISTPNPDEITMKRSEVERIIGLIDIGIQFPTNSCFKRIKAILEKALGGGE